MIWSLGGDVKLLALSSTHCHTKQGHDIKKPTFFAAEESPYSCGPVPWSGLLTLYHVYWGADKSQFQVSDKLLCGYAFLIVYDAILTLC